MLYVRADGVETCQIRDLAEIARLPRATRERSPRRASRGEEALRRHFTAVLHTRAGGVLGRKLLWPLSVSRGAPAARPGRPAPRPALARRTVERRGGWRPGTPAARGTPPSGGRRPRVTNIPASVCESWSWTVRDVWPETPEESGDEISRRSARDVSTTPRARSLVDPLDELCDE